jgi:hypothetical protein
VKVKVLGENTVRLTTDLPSEDVIGSGLQSIIGCDTLSGGPGD